MDRVFTAWIDKHRIIDGDTVEVLLDLGYRIFHRVVVRLEGIDCPEIRRTASKAAGVVAAKAAGRWIEEHARSMPLRVESYRLVPDMYGRTIGDILAGDESLAGWLLGEGLAKATLPGGKRPEWTEAELRRIIDDAPAAPGG